MTEIAAHEHKFYTKQVERAFTFHPDLRVSESNRFEAIKNIEKLPRDSAVIRNGIEIRNSLSAHQQQEILELIWQITRKDFDYCMENKVIDLSEHVASDYLRNDPAVLNRRGWSSDEIELLEQVVTTIVNAEQVIKAQLKFKENGQSYRTLAWTIVGDDNGRKRKLSIAFQPKATHGQVADEMILVVTILKM